jgi:hypothetical protein
MKNNKTKLFYIKLIIGVLTTIFLWGYLIWHLIYSWNNPELTSMQITKHILTIQ